MLPGHRREPTYLKAVLPTYIYLTFRFKSSLYNLRIVKAIPNRRATATPAVGLYVL